MHKICLVIQFVAYALALEKRCTRSSQFPDQLIIEIWSLDGPSSQQILAYSADYDQGCKSVVQSLVIDGQSVSIHALQIVYDFESGVQLYPDPATDDCFIRTSQVSGRYGINVVLQQMVGSIQVSDDFFLIFCDVNDLDDDFIDVSPIDISLNDISPTIQPNRDETFLMQLVNVNNNPVTEVKLGDTVHLQMTYTRPSGAMFGEWPIGVHNFLVTVRHENMAPTDNGVMLIDEYGCLDNVPAAAFPFNLQETFRFFAESQDGSVYYFKTGPFRVAMLEGGNRLLFRGHYRAECLSKTDNKCFDQNLYCSSLTIRKRSTSAEVNGTYDLSVAVNLPGSTTGSFDTSKKNKCDTQTIFWITSVVLGILLLLVTCAAMFLFCSLRTRLPTKSSVYNRRSTFDRSSDRSLVKY